MDEKEKNIADKKTLMLQGEESQPTVAYNNDERVSAMRQSNQQPTLSYSKDAGELDEDFDIPNLSTDFVGGQNTISCHENALMDENLAVTREDTYPPPKKEEEVGDIFNSQRAFPKVPEVTIQKKIGQGGMGVVYKGVQTYLDRTVAVKILNIPSTVNFDEFTARFKREAKILASLSHPNIVSCFQAGSLEGGKCYIVMEFIEGQDLFQYIEKNGKLREEQAIYIIKLVAIALQYAYDNDNIIHRDVKAGNILLQNVDIKKSTYRGIPPYFQYNIKLVDLGLARPSSKTTDSKLTKAGALLGTPATMAPEQFDDPDSVDYRADIYSLGCVLFYILTGKEPYPQPTLTALILSKMNEEIPNIRLERDDISENTCALIEKLLQKDRENRPQSYKEIIHTCDDILSGIAGTEKTAKPLKKEKGKSKVSSLVATVLLITGLLIGGWYYTSMQKSKVEKKTVTKKPVTPTKKKYEKPKKWDENTSLFGAYNVRLKPWKSHGGNWGAIEDTLGISGTGTGVTERSLRRYIKKNKVYKIQGKIYLALPNVKTFGVGLRFKNKDKAIVKLNSSLKKGAFQPLILGGRSIIQKK